MSEETLPLKYLPFVVKGDTERCQKFESGMDVYLWATSDIVYALPAVRR